MNLLPAPHRHPLRILLALWACLGVWNTTQVHSQPSWLPASNTAPELPALVAPIWLRPGMAAQTRLKSSLQFAYLRDNKSAESLRERREYDPEGRLTNVYRFGDQGGVAEKVACEYHGSSAQAASISLERYDAQMELSRQSQHTFDARGRLLSYLLISVEHNAFANYVNQYDAAGQLIQTQHYERDHLPGRATTYQYTPQGKLQTQTDYDLAGEIERVTRYLYDPMGDLSEAQIWEQGKALRYSVRYQFDAAGRLLNVQRVGREGLVTEQETYKYNSKGQRTHISALLPGETKPMQTTLTYDAKGLLKEEKVIDSDGSLFQWHRYRYDSLGTGAGEEHLDAAGKPTMYRLAKYDASSHILSFEQFYHDGSGDEKVIFRWDEHGTILDEKHYQFGQEVDVFWYVHEYY